jgi:hypothetical protein
MIVNTLINISIINVNKSRINSVTIDKIKPNLLSIKLVLPQ